MSIALFVVSRFIKKVFSTECVNIYFPQSTVFVNIYHFSILFSRDFTRWKDLGLPRIAYIVTLNFKGMANLEIKMWYHEITLGFYIELNIYNIEKYKNIYD